MLAGLRDDRAHRVASSEQTSVLHAKARSAVSETGKAGERSRTSDLWFTKPLLYH